MNATNNSATTRPATTLTTIALAWVARETRSCTASRLNDARWYAMLSDAKAVLIASNFAVSNDEELGECAATLNSIAAGEWRKAGQRRLGIEVAS